MASVIPQMVPHSHDCPSSDGNSCEAGRSMGSVTSAFGIEAVKTHSNASGRHGRDY
jgi:hypothetical protein